MKIQLVLEWDVTQKQVKEARDFVNERRWEWDNDPVSAFHFLSQMSWPELIEKKVIK